MCMIIFVMTCCTTGIWGWRCVWVCVDVWFGEMEEEEGI